MNAALAFPPLSPLPPLLPLSLPPPPPPAKGAVFIDLDFSATCLLVP